MRMFGEFLFRGEDLVHVVGAEAVGESLPDGLAFVLDYLDGGDGHVLLLTGCAPLDEL